MSRKAGMTPSFSTDPCPRSPLQVLVAERGDGVSADNGRARAAPSTCMINPADGTTLVPNRLAADLPALSAEEPEEIAYRFPRGRAVIEPVRDHRDTFGLRVAWQRGKGGQPLFETTPLRPLGNIVLNGQTFGLSLNQHKRERRACVRLGGERKIGSAKAARLRCDLVVTGREDRLLWQWRVRARGAGVTGETAADVQFCLPLVPGPVQIVTPPARLSGSACPAGGLAVWRDNVVATFVPAAGDTAAELCFAAGARSVTLCAAAAPVGSTAGARTALEMWLRPAATRAQAEQALLAHLADAADRAQQQTADAVAPRLLALADRSVDALMAAGAADKHGPDRLLLRGTGPRLHGCGDDADAALVAHALLQRFRFSGDDAHRRHALLLARGVCEFQVVDEEAPQRGAFWDVLHAKKHGQDADGNRTVSVATTARSIFGLHFLHKQFGQEILSRAALVGAQWLLLRMDGEGRFRSGRYAEDGSADEREAGSPAWAVSEALRPLVETYRRTQNEVFLRAALRGVRYLREGVEDGSLRPDEAPSSLLSAAIEGVLRVSRESENEAMVALAGRLGLSLRLRRDLDGAVLNDGLPSLPGTLAGCRAALALARVDPDPVWPLFALRGLRTAAARLAATPSEARPADHGALALLPAHLLLALAARAPGCAADVDTLAVTRNDWQRFEPEASTKDYVQVHAADERGEAAHELTPSPPLDHLALVCPYNLQVLIVVLAGPGVAEAVVIKNGRAPYLKNLLTGDYAQRAKLSPLGDGRDASFGVFLADT